MAKKQTSSKSVKRVAKALEAVRSAKPLVNTAPARPTLRKSPFGKAELDEFHQMLLAKRRSLVGDMSGIQAEAFRNNRQDGSGDLSSIPTHPADIGTDNYEQEFTLGLLESERSLLSEINEALERIDDGVYGVCLGTGEPIDKARLRARPWAKYCIEYARKLEKGLVQPPSGETEDEDEIEAPEEEPAAEPEEEEVPGEEPEE